MSIRAKFRPSEDAAGSGESYFVSMTDMMTGFLFIFIIMLMYFVLQLDDITDKRKDTVEQLTSAKKARTDLLRKIEKILLTQLITVYVDEGSGILRLKEELLFSKGSADLTPKGEKFIPDIARAMSEVLPCFVENEGGHSPDNCDNLFDGKVKTVLVEGHTDSDPFVANTGQFSDNWELAAFRAIHTYQALTMASPLLGELRSGGSAVLGVSGYGEARPLNDNLDEEQKKLNRRIDLRFIMESPPPPIIEEVGERIEQRQNRNQTDDDIERSN